MATKTAKAGPLAIAMASTALVVSAWPDDSSKDLVALSVSEADVAVTEIARTADQIETVDCVKKWSTNRAKVGPELTWFCDGKYLPQQQAWLSETAGEEGQRLVLTPKEIDGNFVFDRQVYNGPDPDYQPPHVEPVMPEPVDELEAIELEEK